MKGNKKILIVAVLLLLIAVSYGTYAIYKTSVAGSATVTAAKWDVAFKNVETTLTANYELAFGATECNTNTHVKPGKIAPGVTCTKDIILDAGTSEVDVTYDVTAGTPTIGGSAIDSNANAFTASVSPQNGTIAYSATGTARQQTITVTVAWAGTDDDENPNAADTTIGKAASTITVPLTLVAKQDTSPTPTPQP
jgi:hypothetical protein